MRKDVTAVPTETEKKIRSFEEELKKMQDDTERLTAELENRPLPQKKKPFPFLSLICAAGVAFVLLIIIFEVIL